MFTVNPDGVYMNVYNIFFNSIIEFLKEETLGGKGVSS